MATNRVIVSPVETPKVNLSTPNVAGVVVNPATGGGGAKCLFSIQAVSAAINTAIAPLATEANATANKQDVMGGKMVTYEMDYLPVARFGSYNDYRPVIVGDADYTISEDDSIEINDGIAGGMIFRVLEDNTGEGEHDIMAVPKTVDVSSLDITNDGPEPTMEGVTEWIEFEKDKCYIVTGIYEVTDDDENTWLVYTFAEYEPGRSGKEIYDKVEDVKEAVENINVESADQLAQFFGVADSYEAEAKGGERTNNTVIDECKVRFQDAFNGLLPTGFTMPNSVTVDNLTYTGTTNS